MKRHSPKRSFADMRATDSPATPDAEMDPASAPDPAPDCPAPPSYAQLAAASRQRNEEALRAVKGTLSHVPGYEHPPTMVLRPAPGPLCEGGASLAEMNERDEAILGILVANQTVDAAPLFTGARGESDLAPTPLDHDDRRVPRLAAARPFSPQPGRCVIRNARRFEAVFRAFCNGGALLDKVDLSGAVVAGGAVLECLRPLPPGLSLQFSRHEAALSLVGALRLPARAARTVFEYADALPPLLEQRVAAYAASLSPTSDVDVFLMRGDAAERVISQVFYSMPASPTVEKSDMAVSIVPPPSAAGAGAGAGLRTVQIVTSVAASPGELLQLFDLDCCSVAWVPGQGVVTVPRARWALSRGVNLLSQRALLVRRDRERAVKYALRGFGTLFLGAFPTDGNAGPDGDRCFSRTPPTLVSALAVLADDVNVLRDYGIGRQRVGWGPQALERVLQQLPLTTSNKVDRARSRVATCYQCGSVVSAQELMERACSVPVCRACQATTAGMQWKLDRADLSGAVFVVTGARVKIGHAVALALLRRGATVVATTRFPWDAAQRFAAAAPEVDPARLHIMELDLRRLDAVAAFAQHVQQRFGARLRGLINNAAQTIRRPAAFYASLPRAGPPDALIAPDPHWRPPPGAPMLAGVVGDSELFPAGAVDDDGEQLDLRGSTSWSARPAEVDPVEAVEVQVVNSVAPMMLFNLLFSSGPAAPEGAARYVVNVTSPEGAFSRSKNGAHVHTNMSKAALNMLTRTVAREAAQRGVIVTSVDTGWVSHMGPWRHGALRPPLSAHDAALRVLQPVIEGDMGVQFSGVLLRNFKESSW